MSGSGNSESSRTPPVLSPAFDVPGSENNCEGVPDPAVHTVPHGAGENIMPSNVIPDIRPEDSVSNVSSKLSSSSKARIREIQLKQELAALEETNRLEREKIEMKRKVEEIERKQREISLRSKLKAAMEINLVLDSESGNSEILFQSANKSKNSDSVNNSKGVTAENNVQIVSDNISSGAPCKEESSVDLTSVLNQLIENQKIQELPNQEVQMFNGSDVLLYPTFLKNFEFVVERRTKDPAVRLEFLLKYTSDEARELIKFCPLIEPACEAYNEARRLLDRDYGNPQLIACEFLYRANQWPKIPNGDKLALRKFSIFLTSCVNSKGRNQDMSSMDNFEFIKTLCSKLPIALQQKWIGEVGKFREKENRSPILKDFENFVGILSRNENDPRISGLGYQQRPNFNQKENKIQPKKVNSTQLHHVPRENSFDSNFKSGNLVYRIPCLHCGPSANHSLIICRTFQSLSPAERNDVVKQLGLCFSCLNPGHQKSECKNAEWSRCEKCTRRHHTLMHDPSKDVTIPNSDFSKRPNPDKVTSGCVNADNSDSPLMTIIPILVKLKVSDTPVSTYAFVDNGSSVLFFDKEISHRLKLRSKQSSVILKTINLEENVSVDIVTDEIQISEINDHVFYDLPEAYIRDEIPVTVADAPTQKEIDKWDHLKHLKLPELNDNCVPRVTVMIGSNFPLATTPLEVITGKLGEPYAIKSPLGWLFYGLTNNLKGYISVNFCKIDQRLDSELKKYFNLEFSERLCDERQTHSAEDRKFLSIMENNINLKNGHYETVLPLRNRDLVMPNNQLQAEIFAKKLKRKLITNESLHQQYTTFMSNLEDKNYAEKVPSNELNRSDGKVWFIPHHNVIHPKKPEKVRVVFNCPLVYQNTSLNDQLIPGPDLTNKLLGVLLRWRQDRYAVMGDIESMFYQVRVCKTDVDLMRFLWWPGGDLNQEPVQYRMLVHLFGAVSSPSCANYALKQTARDNIHKADQSIIEAINNDFYVDDFLKSVPTEQQAESLVKNISDVLKTGGFSLKKWVSNSQAVMKSIPEPDRAVECKDLNFDGDNLPPQRALGVKWSVQTDNIEFCVSSMNPKATRRNILSVMSSIYDPIGFACPFVLGAKLILQELCREKLSWDQEIPQPYQDQWKNWLSDLPNLEAVSINRCIKPKFSVAKVQLHHFADASQSAYAMVTYARFESENGEIHVSFLLGRSRVAPLKPHTIVKLELSAATSLVRINNMLKRELTLLINQVFFWTDSQTVLKYIANEKSRHQVFVSNRLAVIRDGSEVDQWRYVPSKQNPADYASRGLSAKNISSVNWISGPDFLHQSEENWPSMPVFSETEDCLSKITTYHIRVGSDSVDKLLSHYSDWIRLKRGVSWWLRLKVILRRKSKIREIPNKLFGKYLTSEEVAEAENVIVSYVQKSEFSEEYKILCESRGSVKSNSVLANLDPVLLDDIICVGGRLRNANIPENAKHQIILPPRHSVSILLVRYYHKSVGHEGRNHTLSELRQRFWIIKGGAIAKEIIRKCIICRKINSRVSRQKMADLPNCRVNCDNKAFSSVGIDYFGHFEIKVGRSIKRRYGVVFTCFTTRAIHIELSDSLDTSSCIAAIRRFIARRGVPKEIFSDNGTNLVGANNELRKSIQGLNQHDLNAFSVNFKFMWHFNTPAASHHGGVWERMIRTVRKILQSVLREQFIKTSQTEEQLRTFLCEVEAIVNSRPLTCVSDDPNDLDVITPNSLLLLQPVTSYPTGVYNERDIYSKRRWRQVQYLAQLFWKRWTKEYLPLLQERQKWLQPQRNLQIGDIVLVVDENAPRCSWLMGVITETYPNKQGLVRSVLLRTKYSTLVRPITKLCLLLEQDE